MMLPGLVSLAFYRRRPSRAMVALGLAFTVVLSGILGYFSPSRPLGTLGSVVVALVGGIALYFGILAYLLYRYQSKPIPSAAPVSPSPPP